MQAHTHTIFQLFIVVDSFYIFLNITLHNFIYILLYESKKKIKAILKIHNSSH